MPDKRNLLIALAAAAAILGGCQSLRLELVDASVQKPSNVALYFTMDTREGEPVPGVTSDQFKIYEDGKLISTYESKQTILNPEVATERYTLLLLDMSGSVVDSGQVPLVQEAVGAFLEGIGEEEKVAVFAFDGREKIQPVADFSSRTERAANRTERLDSWKTEDPSTNLNGAIVAAVDKIQAAMEKSDVPLRFGNIVVFTDGTDRAHRATSEDAITAVDEAKVGIFVIGLGGEVDQNEMQRLGRDGFVHVTEKEAIVSAFERVALRIKGMAARYYLLSYCSPSRAGVHELEVEAVVGEEKGSLSYQFDAEGFEPDCDPTDKPSFDVPGTGKKKRRPGKKAGGGAKAGAKAKAGSPAKKSGKAEEPASKPDTPPPTGY